MVLTSRSHCFRVDKPKSKSFHFHFTCDGTNCFVYISWELAFLQGLKMILSSIVGIWFLSFLVCIIYTQAVTINDYIIVNNPFQALHRDSNLSLYKVSICIRYYFKALSHYDV